MVPLPTTVALLRLLPTFSKMETEAVRTGDRHLQALSVPHLSRYVRCCGSCGVELQAVVPSPLQPRRVVGSFTSGGRRRDGGTG